MTNETTGRGEGDINLWMMASGTVGGSHARAFARFGIGGY